MRAVRLLRECLTKDFETVVDVGCGPGNHTIAFLSAGKKVTSVDTVRPKVRSRNHRHWLVECELLETDEQFDMVWCSHVLEHTRNVGQFLVKLRALLKDDGWLALVVPTNLQDRLHVGHLTLWTPAHLLYNLVVNGWDCREAIWYTEYCSIAVLLRKTGDIDFSGRTAMPSEVDWLNRYMPRTVVHEGDSWWSNNWHEETEDRVLKPPFAEAFLTES